MSDIGRTVMSAFSYRLADYCFPWLGIKAFAVDTLSKSCNYCIMEVDLGSTNAVNKALPTLGWVMTLSISARVPRFI